MFTNKKLLPNYYFYEFRYDKKLKNTGPKEMRILFRVLLCDSGHIAKVNLHTSRMYTQKQLCKMIYICITEYDY